MAVSSSSWRWAIVVGLVLVVLGIVLLFVPYRVAARDESRAPIVIAFQGCFHDETGSAEDAKHFSSCQRHFRVRMGLSIFGLAGGSVLVLAGAIAVSRDLPRLRRDTARKGSPRPAARI